MRLPLQIAFHGIDHSDTVEENVRKKVEKLERLCPDISGCRVVIEAHHHNTDTLKRAAKPFHVRIDLTLSGAELVATRDPKESHVNEDIKVAVNEAFATMERQLKHHIGRLRAPRGSNPIRQGVEEEL